MSNLDKLISFMEEENDHLSFQIGLNNIINKSGIFKKLVLHNESIFISIINQNIFNNVKSDDILLGYYSLGQNRLKISNIFGKEFKKLRFYHPNQQIREAVALNEPNFDIELRAGVYLFEEYDINYLLDEEIVDYYFTYKHKKINKEVPFSDSTLNNILSDGTLSFVLLTEHFKISLRSINSFYFEIMFNNKILIYSNSYNKIITENDDFLGNLINRRTELNLDNIDFINRNKEALNFQIEDILDESYF